MAKLRVTGFSSPNFVQLIPSAELIKIIPVSGGSELYFNTPNRGRLKVTETIIDLYAQQDSALYDLGMVLVTESSKGQQCLLFTHNFSEVGVVQEKDKAGGVVGSRIIQKGLPDFVVDELIADIYAFQKAGVNLGMNLVTRARDLEPLIVMDQHVRYIIDEVVASLTMTYVVFKTGFGKIELVETATAIQTAQSA